MGENIFTRFDEVAAGEGGQALWAARAPYRPEPEYDLMLIPRLPQGFALQFNTDGATYSFSVKDTLDRCNYAIFSDQEKFVYEGTPLTTPRVLPLTTR